MRHIVAQLEGYVVEVGETTFWARLWDFDENEYEGEFYKSAIRTQVDKEWLDEVGEGAFLDIISWNDGTTDVWFIKARWTEQDVNRARKQAREFTDKLMQIAWEDDND